MCQRTSQAQEDVPISRDTIYRMQLKRGMIKNLEFNKLQTCSIDKYSKDK